MIIFTFFILKCFVYCFILLSVQMLCGYSVFCTVLYILDFSNYFFYKKVEGNTVQVIIWECSTGSNIEELLGT